MHECFKPLVGNPDSDYAYISEFNWRTHPSWWYHGADGAGYYLLFWDYDAQANRDRLRYHRIVSCPICQCSL